VHHRNAGGRGDAVDVVAQHRIVEQDQNGGSGGHAPSLRAHAGTIQPRTPICGWMPDCAHGRARIGGEAGGTRR